MILPMIASIFLIIAIVCFLNLTPQQISQDINSVISKKPNLRDRARALRAGKNKKGLGAKLEYLQSALASCGKEGKFALVCSSALVLFAIGAVVAVLIDNVFLIPALSVAFAMIPFIYVRNIISIYEKQTKEELETTLSIITTSYTRVDTDKHTYLLRLNPRQGEYNLYCYCYVKKYPETQLVQVSKGIRFITPHYREIFRILDGDKILITHSDGERVDKVCRYIDDYHTEVGDRLYHICEFAEIMERNGNKVIPLRSSLPNLCYAIHPESDKLVIITKGEKDFLDVNDERNTPEQNRKLADGHSSEMGVTKAQKEAMLGGITNGWQTPSANPQNYNEQGKFIHSKQHERGEAR